MINALDMQGIRITEGMRVTSADTLGYGIVTAIGEWCGTDTPAARVLWVASERALWHSADALSATHNRYGLRLSVIA